MTAGKQAATRVTTLKPYAGKPGEVTAGGAERRFGIGLPDAADSPGALIHGITAPLIAIGSLLACMVAFDVVFTAPYMVLALLVFSLCFPGAIPRKPGIGAMIRDALGNWASIAALLLLLGWATRSLDAFDPRVIASWLIVTPLALIPAHLAIPFVLPRLMAQQGMQRVAVIAGAGELAEQLAARLRALPALGVRLAGCFDDRGPGRRRGGVAPGEVLGGIDQLAAHVKHHRADLIFITLPMASQPRILKLLDELRDTTASIYFVPDIFVFDLIQARVGTIGGIPVVSVCETPFYGLNGVVKRASDLLLAGAILIAIAPLMLAVAIAIKLTSPGPILFRQRRYGLDGREIVVYKFRSMTVLEDDGEIRQATPNDPRVTRLGAFLRKTSLDELPQFINVLQGRMSVVGPRPHAVAHNEMYRKLVDGYMIRHKVKPGITGWAQVNGLRGETESVDKMRARIEYDLTYLRTWSLRLDLKIVLKTLVVVLKKQNAY